MGHMLYGTHTVFCISGWPEKPGFGSFDSAHALGFRETRAELLHAEFAAKIALQNGSVQKTHWFVVMAVTERGV